MSNTLHFKVANDTFILQGCHGYALLFVLFHQTSSLVCFDIFYFCMLSSLSVCSISFSHIKHCCMNIYE